MTDDILTTLATGYTFAGPSIDLGAAVVDGTAHADTQIRLPLAMMNRHGLVAGATGTGKTKTLQLMAEQLATAGVPVFLADVKGDVSGIAVAGEASDRVTKRAGDVGGDPWTPLGFATEFYALGGIGPGVPLRARMTSFGPTLLSKVLGLNDVQTSSLGLVFHYADGAGLDLDDVKDLRAIISYLASDEGAADLQQLGGLSKATAGVLLRELIGFSDQGADAFFGEPEFDSGDLLRTAPDGRGMVSCLELPAVQDRPALFSTFLMWLLADLFHDLPEVGDVDKPKLVFFFDEAHLLFRDASKDFLDSIAQTVRLIRSKGIGVFFVTQSPTDVPDEVLAQLGNRVQHALRSFTPADAKALKATVSTFPRSSYDLEALLTQLGIGEAVVTVLSENGAPTPVAWTRLRPPASRMGPMDAAAMTAAVVASPLAGHYATTVDDESAYEKLQAMASGGAHPGEEGPAPEQQGGDQQAGPAATSHAGAAAGIATAAGGIFASPMFRSFARSAATVAGREIARSIFGTAPRRRAPARRRRY